MAGNNKQICAKANLREMKLTDIQQTHKEEHVLSSAFFCFFLSYSGWHTLPSHASVRACLKTNLLPHRLAQCAQPQGRD